MKRPKYVSSDFDRHGNERWYVRPPGSLKIRLPGGMTHPHFDKAYRAAMSGDPKNRTPKKAGAAPKKCGTGFVYFLRIGDRVKIGYSRNPFQRLSELSTALADPVTSFVFFPGNLADEKRLHRHVESRRTSGEWYRADGLLVRLMAQAAAYGMLPTTPAIGGEPSHLSDGEEPVAFSPPVSV
jgi:Meiotically up-regulated gene 113